MLDGVQSPKRKLTMYIYEAPGSKETAVALQAMWKPLGIDVEIKTQEWGSFLKFLGPPPDPSVDAFLLGWIGDFPDAINFLELWTCKSGNNNTQCCDPEYDKLAAEARRTADETARINLYRQMEERLTGPDGLMPVAPTTWPTTPNLERANVSETLEFNVLGMFDLTKVAIRKE